MSILDSTVGRRARVRPAAAGRGAARALMVVWRVALPAAIGATVFTWGKLTFAPESDPALHLALIRGIAEDGRLPTELPHFPAAIGEGGVVEAMFPYSYTPLYHVAGAALYSLWGDNGVLLINAAAAAAIATVVYVFVARRMPWFIASVAAVLVFLPTLAQSLFFQTFMEPPMLALYLAAAWMLYLASARRSVAAGVVAGVLLGLAVGVRQVALIYVGVLALVTLLHLADRRCWRFQRLRLELPWMLAASIALAATAVPFLAYLTVAHGTVGYAELTLPGTRPSLAIDPAATAYISAITKPDASFIEWVDKYRRTFLFNERWIPLPYQIVPFGAFIIGAVHLVRRGGAARFYARLAFMQIIVELALFVVVHASSRYVIASQMLFHSVIPVGAYVAARACAGLCTTRTIVPPRLAMTGAAFAVVLIIAPALFSVGYARYMRDSYVLRDFRSRSHAEAAAWLNANTPEDALILTPRTYTAELTFERDVVWVTYFGNAWVIDVINAKDLAEAHRILTRYGIDYVLIPAPAGTYVDRMPVGGLRRALQFGAPETPYFSLEYVTAAKSTYRGDPVEAGLRIYRVNTLEATR